MEVVWHDAIVSDETLTIAVSDLRRSLGDNPRAPRYIETILKGGYRIIASVETADVAAKPGSEPRRSGFRWWATVTLVLLAIILIVVVGSQTIRRVLRSPLLETPTAALKSVPLTSYPSSEITPAISNDGLRVAFAWAGSEEHDLDIYVKQINTDPPLQLTDDSSPEWFPAWSPNNDQIAFVRGGELPGIYVMPSIGGYARQLARLPGPIVGLDWSPDGRALYYSTINSSKNTYSLFSFLLETGEVIELENCLVAQIDPPTGAYFPACSPDGCTIAYVRSDCCRLRDIWLLPVERGEPSRLTYAQRKIDGLDWTADGRSLVFSSSPTGNQELWLVDIRTGKLTWLPSKGDIVQYPSIATHGDRLVYENTSYNDDIWEIDLAGPGEIRLPDAPLISSTHEDSNAAPEFAFRFDMFSCVLPVSKARITQSDRACYHVLGFNGSFGS